MGAIEFVVVGDPERAKATAVDALNLKGFRLAWSDPWTATAEKGNKAANVILGGLAQYIKVDLEVRATGAPDQSLIRLVQGSKGYMGGALGVAKTNKHKRQLRDDLAGIFQQAGVLVGVNES